MSIGENIKFWREKRDLKQFELAAFLGVSDKTVSSWEINRTEPKMSMVEKISHALNCKKTDIIGREDELAESSESYYLNQDAHEMAQFLYENPDYKILFDASKNVKVEDIEFVKQMIDRVNRNH